MVFSLHHYRSFSNLSEMSPGSSSVKDSSSKRLRKREIWPKVDLKIFFCSLYIFLVHQNIAKNTKTIFYEDFLGRANKHTHVSFPTTDTKNIILTRILTGFMIIFRVYMMITLSRNIYLICWKKDWLDIIEGSLGHFFAVKRGNSFAFIDTIKPDLLTHTY